MPCAVRHCQGQQQARTVLGSAANEIFIRQTAGWDLTYSTPITCDGPMALATLRPLLERPFRQYATFSGRSGRAEFWLFVLTFFVATSIAWPLGYGAMKLAGYESHDDKGTFHHHDPSEDGALDHDVLSDRLFGAHDRTAIFKLHRHPGEEGYHLHGLIGPLPGPFKGM